MLTINNNANTPNFTSTFTFKNPKKYDFQHINQVLNSLRAEVTGNHVPNGNFRCGSVSAAVYCSKDVRSGYFDQYASKNRFKVQRDSFFYETERPLKTKPIKGSNPPHHEIDYNNNFPFDKVTVSVPDSKDSIIQKLLDSVGIKYTARKLPSEKSCKYVLINSDELKKQGGILWKVKIINHFREFQQGEIITGFLDTVEQPFRILTARANKGDTYELELRVPKKLIPNLKNNLEGKDFVVKVSDKPKHLNYA